MHLIDKNKIDEKTARDIGRFLGTCSELKAKMNEVEQGLKKIRQVFDDRDKITGDRVDIGANPRITTEKLLEVEALASQLCGFRNNKTNDAVKGLKNL